LDKKSREAEVKGLEGIVNGKYGKIVYGNA